MVNDQSNDRSIHFLEEMDKKYDFLKLLILMSQLITVKEKSLL